MLAKIKGKRQIDNFVYTVSRDTGTFTGDVADTKRIGKHYSKAPLGALLSRVKPENLFRYTVTHWYTNGCTDEDYWNYITTVRADDDLDSIVTI